MEFTASQLTELRVMANRILELTGPEPEAETVYLFKCSCCGHKHTCKPTNCVCGAYMYPERCIALTDNDD